MSASPKTNRSSVRTDAKVCADLPKVALLFETKNSYARTLLIGIGEYLLSHGPWQVQLVELGEDERPPAWLKSWDGQGVIVRGENKQIARAVAKLAVPVVDLTPSRLLPHAPWVKADDAAIARLAAQHFLERGFRHFAFCGDERFSWSNRRSEHFSLLANSAGFRCDLYKPARFGKSGDGEIEAIGEWLKQLPKPAAVFACYDNRGQQVLEACRRFRFSVPEDVAVLGVDNDEVLCVLSPPPLSSVMLNPRRTGWEAAALLAQMMRGETLPVAAHLIPPVAVVTRQSSDILAVADKKIAAALRYIREHACDGIRVSDVVRHCPMARRAMETRFKKILGRTPRQEILRVQLARVKEFLIGPELAVWEIAERTGFDPEYLSVVFKQETGMAPSEFRKRYGVGR